MNTKRTPTIIPSGEYKNKPHFSIFIHDPSYVANLINYDPTGRIADGFFKHAWDLDALPFVVQCEDCEDTATYALGGLDNPHLSFHCPHCAIEVFSDPETTCRVMRSFMEIMNNFDDDLADVDKRRRHALLLLLRAKGIDRQASLEAHDFRLKINATPE